MSEILVPDLGESISEGTIYKWLVKEGDTVGQGDVLAELETDKVNLEISAEVEGVISTILRQAGENVAVGEAIGIIGAASGSTPRTAESEAEAPKAAPAGGNAVAAAAPVAAPEVPAAGGDSHAALASPGARKLARERGIDLGEVSARDPIGRIGQADVSGHGAAAPQAAAPVAPAPQGKPEPAKPAAGKATPDEGKTWSASACRADGSRLPAAWSKRSRPRPCLPPSTRWT